MSPFARKVSLGVLLLLGACQLPSSAPLPKTQPKRSLAELFGISKEADEEWEPPLPGKDLPHDRALAYAFREAFAALPADEQEVILGSLNPPPPSVLAPEPETAELQNPALPGFCGASGPLCDADRPTSMLMLPDHSAPGPWGFTLERSREHFERWRVPEGGPSELPPIPTLALVLGELSSRFGSDDLAIAALLLGPDVERRMSSSHPKSLVRVALWLPAKRLPLVERVKEARTLAALYAFAWPVSTRAAITSEFGLRYHPVLGGLRQHKGVDIGVPTGTEIRAPFAGTVRTTHEDKRNGLWLTVDHGGGILTVYCHASELKVKKGDKVQAGDVLALSGETGIATGPHLHYQLHLQKAAVDPLRFRAYTAENLFKQSQLSAAGGSP